MSSLENITQVLKDKKKMNRLLIGLFGLVEVLILIMMAATLWQGQRISDIVAMELILLWFGIVCGYLAWAIYFYNINLGLTNQDWAEIREKKKNGEHVDEPTENPHKDETLGLPKGTVRGTVALTMLVGGLAMTVFSFGLDTDYAESSFIVDHLDFFKTAFLMMIAFYFGNKSLEAIGYKSQRVIKVGGGGPKGSPPSSFSKSASEARKVLESDLDEVDAPTADNNKDSDFDNPNALG